MWSPDFELVWTMIGDMISLTLQQRLSYNELLLGHLLWSYYTWSQSQIPRRGTFDVADELDEPGLCCHTRHPFSLMGCQDCVKLPPFLTVGAALRHSLVGRQGWHRSTIGHGTSRHLDVPWPIVPSSGFVSELLSWFCCLRRSLIVLIIIYETNQLLN